MALYQPTNIIPSSYTKGTVDAVNDKMEISWQVNGNSAMTAFQIDFYLNDANSTYVTSTGRLTDNCPFYGTDRFGRPQFFTWNAKGQTWEEWSKYQLTNGNEYKYKITQWYKGENSVVKLRTDTALAVGKTYYFYFREECVDEPLNTVYFSVPVDLSKGVTYVYYSRTDDVIWVVNGSQLVICSGKYVGSESTLDGAIRLYGLVDLISTDERFISQKSSNIMVTRDKPTLTIFKSNNQYVDEIDFPNNGSITTSIGFFKAVYTQLQSDPIRWIRWQVATANNGNVGEILADTGDIYTPTLNYEFNGFFNGQQYAIRAIGESESGQECDSGWILFTINIENQGEYSGEFTVQCLNKENATLLEWEGVEVISPKKSPQGYEPTISNGSVTLLPKDGDTDYSVTWDSSGANPMNFSAPWTAVWKGSMRNTVDITYLTAREREIDGRVRDCAFSPDGNLFAICGSFRVTPFGQSYNGALFSVNKNNVSIISAIPNLRNDSLYTCVFNADSKLLLIGNKLFSVDSNGATYLSELFPGIATKAAFSPSGKLLTIYTANRKIKVYSIDGNSATYLYDIDGLGGFSDFLFNPTGTLFLVLESDKDFVSGSVKSQAHIKVYSVKETAINFLYNVDVGEPFAFSSIDSLSFSPNGTILVAARGSLLYTFMVDGNLISLIDKTVLTENIGRIIFSPDGCWVFVFGINDSKNTFIYSVRNEQLVFTSKNTNIISGRLASLIQQGDHLLLATCPSHYTSFLFLYDMREYVYPKGKLFDIQSNDISVMKDNYTISCLLNNSVVVTFHTTGTVAEVAIVLSPNNIYAYFYDAEGAVSIKQIPISYIQQHITSLSIYGGDSGTTVDSISVYQGDGSNVLSLYENPDFEPVWNSPDYELYMTANFNGNLEGATGTATGSGFRVYRQEVGKNVLTPIATVPSTTTSIKDYGIVSRKAYKYSLYAYDNNGAFMSAVENEKVVATCFKNYSLLVCDYDEENDEYHVRKQYLFALNLSTGSVGNNNSPTLNANFTRYPTRMPSAQNYASGTLQGLIGAIYTVPALIEQIGNYKWTAKPSTLDYFDSVDLEQELYDLSTAPYQLFLRDMKGRLRMVATNGAITMTTNIKQKQQSISISFPWVEIGDASDVTIIQTPDDYGWNNDNQVLDVSLDVDVNTGELSATYPFPYNGTKFYLTGVNKENLTAKTPLGITPAQFNLSETASKPDDGELTATVKVNSEDNLDYDMDWGAYELADVDTEDEGN